MFSPPGRSDGRSSVPSAGIAHARQLTARWGHSHGCPVTVFTLPQRSGIMNPMRSVAVVVSFCGLGWADAAADDSKLGKEGIEVVSKGWQPGKNKLCCGYPLSEPGGFRYTYYWMADQHRHQDTARWQQLPARVLDFQGVGVDNGLVDIYTAERLYLATVIESFANELKMEGSGWLADGRVVNYASRCSLGVGICFEILDPTTHPHGRGAGLRPLVPFRSVAVDPELVAIGETLYAPEFDGLPLPDGSVHDGCLRADDTGGAIRNRLVDVFVVELENFMWVNRHMWHDRYFTPHIEDPRCDYLADQVVDP